MMIFMILVAFSGVHWTSSEKHNDDHGSDVLLYHRGVVCS